MRDKENRKKVISGGDAGTLAELATIRTNFSCSTRESLYYNNIIHRDFVSLSIRSGLFLFCRRHPVGSYLALQGAV